MSTGIAPTYPVRVDGRLDPGLSRWLWLVKWLLVIPHYIVLAFLWIAFVVLSVVAFFAILFTGRYPRGIFDFNVGVLRWTLARRRSTPTAPSAPTATRRSRSPTTRLPRDARRRLPRAALARARAREVVAARDPALHRRRPCSSAAARGRPGRPATAPCPYGGGLIGLLVLIAVVALLFTGRYPRGIFDLVLGMNRWVLRVAAYAGPDDRPLSAVPPRPRGGRTGHADAAAAEHRARGAAGAGAASRAAAASRCSPSSPAASSRSLAAGLLSTGVAGARRRPDPARRPGVRDDARRSATRRAPTRWCPSTVHLDVPARLGRRRRRPRRRRSSSAATARSRSSSASARRRGRPPTWRACRARARRPRRRDRHRRRRHASARGPGASRSGSPRTHRRR